MHLSLCLLFIIGCGRTVPSDPKGYVKVLVNGPQPNVILDHDGKSGYLQSVLLTASGLTVAASEKNEPAGYLSHEEMLAAFSALATSYPQHAELETFGASEEGRELFLIRLSRKEDLYPKPKVLLLANMHGDETVGRHLMLETAREILEKHPEVVNYSEVFIVPTMNPDGFAQGMRWNADGVDLNRDFPDFVNDPDLSITGRAKETQAVMLLHQRHRFALALNFHGGAVCFNMPWDAKPNVSDRFGDWRFMLELATQYANDNPQMASSVEFPAQDDVPAGVTFGYEWYELHGGLQDYASFFENSVHATVEVSDRKFPPESQLDHFWDLNREGILGFVNSARFGYFYELPESGLYRVDGSERMLSHDGTVMQPSRAASRGFVLDEVRQISASPKWYKGQLERVETLTGI